MVLNASPSSSPNSCSVPHHNVRGVRASVSWGRPTIVGRFDFERELVPRPDRERLGASEAISGGRRPDEISCAWTEHPNFALGLGWGGQSHWTGPAPIRRSPQWFSRDRVASKDWRDERSPPQ